MQQEIIRNDRTDRQGRNTMTDRPEHSDAGRSRRRSDRNTSPVRTADRRTSDRRTSDRKPLGGRTSHRNPSKQPVRILPVLLLLCVPVACLMFFLHGRKKADAVPETESLTVQETVAEEIQETLPETEAPETDMQEEEAGAVLHAWEVFPQNGEVLTAVNARASVEGDSAVLSVLQEGQTVVITGTDGTHYMVETENGTGYVVRKYIIPELYLAGNHPPFKAPSLESIDPDKPMVALTFDDRPNAPSTNRVLAVLEKYGAHATFYLMGSNVYGENNDCVRKMIELGCEIGNHTYNHNYFNLQPVSEIRPSVRKADYMIEETCGQMPATVRPPGGGIVDEAAQELETLGLAAIFWSIDTLDWETKDPDNTYKVVMENVRDGDIILMHDVHQETADAAERIIPSLLEKGYQLVTVSELAAARDGELEPGKMYREFWK